MRKINTSYDGIDEIKLENFGHTLKNVTNFSVSAIQEAIIKPENIDEYAYISGNSFIIDLTGYAHFHFIYDQLAQYEFIKTYIDDLSVYIMSDPGRLEAYSGVVVDIKNAYKIPDSHVLSLALNKTYVFKKAYFIWPMHNTILSGSFPSRVHFVPWVYPKDFEHYIQVVRECLLKTFKRHMLPFDPNKKTFISRFNQHEKYGRGTDPIKLGMRYISKDDEIKLEKFFSDLGYYVYFTENLNLSDQIALYSSSAHIAALKSSALVNIIFCDPKVRITSINLDDEYQVWYDWIAQAIGLEYKEFPSLGRMSQSVDHETHKMTKFSIDTIINSLNAEIGYITKSQDPLEYPEK